MFFRAALTTCLILLLATPALAQSRAELAARNQALQERVERLESRMLTGDPAAERLMSRVDTLEQTIRTLVSEIENLNYERERAEARIDTLESEIVLLQDLSTRFKIHLDAVDLIAEEERRRASPQVDETYVGGSSTLNQIQGPPESRTEDFVLPPVDTNPANDATQLGEVGLTRLAEGDYAAAERAFQQYLDFNPDAGDRGVIQYWLGESHFVRGQFNTAAESYIASMRTDRNGERAPDALIKLAASLREVGQQDEACAALASFADQFPNADQAARDKAARETTRTGC